MKSDSEQPAGPLQENSDNAGATPRSYVVEPAHAPLPQPKKRGLSWVGPVLTLVVLVSASAWLALNHDLAGDWLATRGYHAPSDIQQMADDTSMTPYAKRLFYVNKPQVEDRDAFNKECSNDSDQVSVLGCYTGNRQGIFIYNVTDSRLEGIQQVTAAHEMLHQAYDRLSDAERAKVDKMLEDYAKTVTDPELLSKMDAYKKSEPHQLVNEYHSIFGTEVARLPAPLEDYYKQYFTDRAKVTALHDKYQAVFTERTNQIATYDKQLDTLKKQIESDKASIASQEADLKSRRSQLDALLAANNVSDYNAAVPGFNADVSRYKATVSSTNAHIDEYNKIIDARNSIAVEEQQLQQALDSHAATASEQ